MVDFHYSWGKSIWNIAKLVNLNHVWKGFKEENPIEIEVRRGRPTKLTKHDNRFFNWKFVKNSHLSAAQVTAEFNENFSFSISPETVRRVLRAAGLNGRSARRKFCCYCEKQKV